MTRGPQGWPGDTRPLWVIAIEKRSRQLAQRRSALRMPKHRRLARSAQGGRKGKGHKWTRDEAKYWAGIASALGVAARRRKAGLAV